MDLHRRQGEAVTLQITNLTTHFNECHGFLELLPRRRVPLRARRHRGCRPGDACARAMDVWRGAPARGICACDWPCSYPPALGRATYRGWGTDMVALRSGHLPGIDLLVGRRANFTLARWRAEIPLTRYK